MAFGDLTSPSFEGSGIEYEVEIYLENFDLSQIQAMASSKEHQEQWGIYVPKTDQNASGGSLRVRKTIFQDGTTLLEDCCKTELGENGKFEDESTVSEARFKQFELLADQGLIKVRYVVPSETRVGVAFKYEVDVFYNKAGELVPWAKVDVEFEKGTVLSPDEIPFTRDTLLFVTPEDKAADKDGIRAKVGAMYKKYFCATNKFVSAE
jgi:hypothetical protein